MPFAVRRKRSGNSGILSTRPAASSPSPGTTMGKRRIWSPNHFGTLMDLPPPSVLLQHKHRPRFFAPVNRKRLRNLRDVSERPPAALEDSHCLRIVREGLPEPRVRTGLLDH